MNMIRIAPDWRKVMTTCYFDRNVFDQIDRKRDVTDGDLTILRKAIRDDQLSVLVSFETVQETSYAKKDTALRGLRLIQELARAEFPIKPHDELLRDDITAFAQGKENESPFLFGKFQIETVINDVENPSAEVLSLIEDDKREKIVLNEKLARYVDDERRILGDKRPRPFARYWDLRSTFYAEGFAYFAGHLDQAKELGIDRLLQLRSVRLTVGAFLSLLYSILIEGHVVQNGTSRDIQHVAPMSAADIIVTDDGELRRLIGRVPIENLVIITLPELIAFLRGEIPLKLT